MEAGRESVDVELRLLRWYGIGITGVIGFIPVFEIFVRGAGSEGFLGWIGLPLGVIVILLGGRLVIDSDRAEYRSGFGRFAISWSDVVAIETNAARSVYVLRSVDKRLPLEVGCCTKKDSRYASGRIEAEAHSRSIPLRVVGVVSGRSPKGVRVARG